MFVPIKLDIDARANWEPYDADGADIGWRPRFDSWGVGIRSMSPLTLHPVLYSDSLASNDRGRFGFPAVPRPAHGQVAQGEANRLGVVCLAISNGVVHLTRANSNNLLGAQIAPTGAGGVEYTVGCERDTLREIGERSIIAEVWDESGITVHKLEYLGTALSVERGYKPECFFRTFDFTVVLNGDQTFNEFTDGTFTAPFAAVPAEVPPILAHLLALSG